MQYLSYNYHNLENLTPAERTTIADVTYQPTALVSRCSILLNEFISQYIATKANRDKLITDLQLAGDVIEAQLESISEQLYLAEKMLDECQQIDEFLIGGALNNGE